MENQSCVNIQTEWDIVAARQLGRNVAKELGFGIVDQARITTAISELARNIFIYANKGRVCIEKIYDKGHAGLRIVAIDNGPGINDIRLAMEDGYSTSGGLGAGLPGVKRLMDEFDIVSSKGKGTEIVATKWIR
ncbi:serine/threonine-protein kinase RsbT [Robertmurraya siralis]|uniref:Serine/threonine-protein kinase RsbT n=1 Tax=Robertmurraya siralis TaxID=77777 RepID=A0A920BVG5_9BACI|nr:anti-sigma regulatory factor [Robertmurraya siralis]PAE19847.1 ATP-binding protein [Bacillus sp. 7504-2]GIN63516.1 serine/threonine-protein kinase RsbT [Robertmurraya siralis]